jgi:hypothetical protein
MCFNPRNLEVLEDFEDDDFTDTEEPEEPEEPQDCYACGNCDECYKTILKFVNHMLVKCCEQQMNEEECLSLPAQNMLRVVMYVHNLRKENLEEVASSPEEDSDMMEAGFNVLVNVYSPSFQS